MNDTLKAEAIAEFHADVAQRKAALKHEPDSRTVDTPIHILYHYNRAEKPCYGYPGAPAEADIVTVTLPGIRHGKLVRVEVELPSEVLRYLEREILYG